MRVLATIGFSFAAGIFLTLLPWDGWQLYAAGVLALVSLLWGLLGRRSAHFRRGLLILLPLTVSLLYFTAYRALVRQPVQALCGAENDFSAAVCDWPEATEHGAKVTLRLHGFPGTKAVYYGDSDLLALSPGDTVSGAAWWNDVATIGDGDLRQFSSRSVYVLLYARGETEVQPGLAGDLRYLPQRAAKILRDKLAQLWDDPSVLGFLTAELTGDKSLLPEEDYVAMQETGLAHIFAVSGLHCAFLVTLLSLLIPPARRRTLCAVAIPVLLFYMLLTGLSPSVVRACVMQVFLLIAPLFRRSSDPLTSLAAALTVILLANPYAVGSVSLQLSFAATLGMVLLSGRLYRSFTGWYRGKSRALGRVISFVAANHTGRIGIHHTADGVLLQHSVSRRAPGRTAGRARRRLRLHVRLRLCPPGLCLDAPGPYRGICPASAGQICPVAGPSAADCAVPCGVLHQYVSAGVAAARLRCVYRLRRHPGRQA